MDGKDIYLGFYATSAESAAVQAVAREEQKSNGMLTEEWLLTNTSRKPKKHCVFKRGKKFKAQITSNGKNIYLGRYNTEGEATEMLRQARVELKSEGELTEQWLTANTSIVRNLNPLSISAIILHPSIL